MSGPNIVFGALVRVLCEETKRAGHEHASSQAPDVVLAGLDHFEASRSLFLGSLPSSLSGHDQDDLQHFAEMAIDRAAMAGVFGATSGTAVAGARALTLF